MASNGATEHESMKNVIDTHQRLDIVIVLPLNLAACGVRLT